MRLSLFPIVLATCFASCRSKPQTPPAVAPPAVDCPSTFERIALEIPDPLVRFTLRSSGCESVYRSEGSFKPISTERRAAFEQAFRRLPTECRVRWLDALPWIAESCIEEPIDGRREPFDSRDAGHCLIAAYSLTTDPARRAAASAAWDRMGTIRTQVQIEGRFFSCSIDPGGRACGRSTYPSARIASWQ